MVVPGKIRALDHLVDNRPDIGTASCSHLALRNAVDRTRGAEVAGNIKLMGARKVMVVTTCQHGLRAGDPSRLEGDVVIVSCAQASQQGVFETVCLVVALTPGNDLQRATSFDDLRGVGGPAGVDMGSLDLPFSRPRRVRADTRLDLAVADKIFAVGRNVLT